MITTDRALIVDDEEAIRLLVAKIAEREGVDVDLAKDGAQALEKIEKHDYAVILLDLMMPILNGFDVLDRVRALRERPLVIVMTAVDAPVLNNLDPALVQLVLRKPFDVDDVGFLIRLTAKEIAAERRNHRAESSSTRMQADLA